MEVIKYPARKDWGHITARPHFDHAALQDKVAGILQEVRELGDAALFKYEEMFDRVSLNSLAVSEAEWDEADSLLSEELKRSIRQAHDNIARFHASQAIQHQKIETMPGVTCWQKSVGIDAVGLYIPGGTAPLFSTVLMLAIPAKIAGCRNIVMCTPPNKEGKVHPAILVSAKTAGVTCLFKLGGVQAIGAMAYGTQSVPKVYKIFGPGNQYVMAAKQLVSLSEVAIDMPAGPSEVEVIADASANPAFVASDFLSQAEHGADSQSILMTTDDALVAPVQAEIERQLTLLPRRELVEKSLSHSKIVVLKDYDELMALTNEYAPEHLIIQTANYRELAGKVINAGSVFLGPYTPESAGDYASGTNHTLPTSGYAKAYSGVNLDSFLRKITFQEITPQGLYQIGNIVETMAANEQLDAHKNAVALRLDSLKQ
ncbi:MAG TPA: histidinol dehydrogenase [Candidatus Gallibacteroides avistercoris]|uniref:Histidinol dehydrogenase n=1 Tax=Candidatus Gallibacteroides avistercoris TaxID=2840833 RepID=A0A9D1M868_9BACT|nr:histidinol dehydrogenase [Candidatus Gallibacteroides avistercoris]